MTDGNVTQRPPHEYAMKYEYTLFCVLEKGLQCNVTWRFNTSRVYYAALYWLL